MTENKTDQHLLIQQYSILNQNLRCFVCLRILLFCFFSIVFFTILMFLTANLSVPWWDGQDRIIWSKIYGLLIILSFVGLDGYFQLSIWQAREQVKKLEESLSLDKYDFLHPHLLFGLSFAATFLYVIGIIFLVFFN